MRQSNSKPNVGHFFETLYTVCLLQNSRFYFWLQHFPPHDFIPEVSLTFWSISWQLLYSFHISRTTGHPGKCV